MGKVAATEMKQRKKRGRPPKNSLSPYTPQKPVNYDSAPATSRRSSRGNPNLFNSPTPEFDGGDDDDDDDERKEKKVKLVVRLPQSEGSDRINNQKQQQQKNRRHSRDDDSVSGSGSDSGPESEDREAYAKRRKINAVVRGSDGSAAVQEKKEVVKETDLPLHGSPLESGPTTPLPDKKLLIFILDRLQKKDTYGVFSEPVDVNELPDYFEVIEQPMDFGTLRKKLDAGAYKNLEELEADVFLICSNAMQYNAEDTVYYRQARSIQEIAKRDFENLRHEGDNGEPQPKVVRRGRPPSVKTQKKLLETSFSPVDSVGPELPSVAALPSGEDKVTGHNSYNLRKAPAVNRFRSSDIFVSSYGSKNGVNYSEWLADWNDEFPAKILRADMKYGKRQFMVDENRRDTYRQFHPLSSANGSPALSNSIGRMKQLVPVGLHEPLAYARSLARFAANLGPVAWQVASRRLETALPAGMRYGPGWVGENGPHSQPLSSSTEKQRSSNSSAGDFCNSNKLATPSTSDLNSVHAPPEAVGEHNDSPGERGLHGVDAAYTRTPFPVQQKPPVYQSRRNGFDGMFAYDMTSKTAGPVFGNDFLSSHLSATGHIVPSGCQYTQRHNSGAANSTVLGPPDLNVRIPAGSPSSSLQIGSSQLPDLALQL